MIDDPESDDDLPKRRLLLMYRPPKSKEQSRRYISGKTTIGSDSANDLVISTQDDPTIS